MDSKGGNPFLMDDFGDQSGQDANQQAPINPFLQDFGGAAEPQAGENPFLSFMAADQSYQPPSDSTNPFASFGFDSAAPEAAPEATATNLFAAEEPNLFAAAPTEPPTADFFVTDEPEPPPPEPDIQITEQPAEPPQEATPSRAVPPPRGGGPSRPPPPPRPPPAVPQRNTKDLILSVTGEMDATSNHLLDRLQATRTPSPTLMHSPSPTPEHSYADFLDVDNNVPDLLADDARVETSKSQDMFDLFSAPSTETSAAAAIFSVPQTDTSTIMTEPSTVVSDTIAHASPPVESAFVENSDIEIESETTFQEPEIPFDEKRPSISATTPFPSAEDAADFAPQPPPQTLSYSSDVSDIPVQAAASPTPAAEFPVAGDYQPQEAYDHYTAAVAPTTPIDTAYVAPAATEPMVDSFDAFASAFDRAGETDRPGADPFASAFGGGGQVAMDTSSDVWGDSTAAGDGLVGSSGFDEGDEFDSFMSMTAPVETRTRVRRTGSGDSDEAPDFTVIIKPKEGDQFASEDGGPVPVLAPPPKSALNSAYADSAPRFNPFDKSGFGQEVPTSLPTAAEMTRTDSQETPPTPLFDEDVSQPLLDFPRIHYEGEGWEMQLRQPNKKKMITSQRFWKKIFVRLVWQGDSPVLQIFNNKGDKDPFQELPLLACYSVSDIAAQQYDQYGKIFTLKLQYIFYKERPGVRPGQVSKAEKLSTRLSKFAAYAIQGDYEGVKEFGSDLKKLGLPVEHAPQVTQLFKLGSHNYEDLKQFSCVIEETLFKLSAHRDRALTYKMEEVQVTVVDELYVEQSCDGLVEKQIARVRLFVVAFLNGMPDIELGINDMWRQGKEVVGRHDIIPVVTEEWIRLEAVEFHNCVQQDEYERSKLIKFKPPDANYIELMRFRVRPPKNRELPLQLKAVMCVTGNKVELRADILVPGFASRKLGQIPCEDVMVRFPIPECWIYLFRVEKHFRYGSVKSAHRRTGKVKGIERFLGAVDTMEPQLMEVTSGQAKYEHQHRSIVWRMPRLPKEGQGAYTNHQLVCRMALTSYDQIPDQLTEYAYVEFTMPATQVSHTTARSVSLQNSDSDEPPEKYVRNLSRHEYRVGIEHTQGQGPGAYVAATKKIPEEPEPPAKPAPAPAADDSDSSFSE